MKTFQQSRNVSLPAIADWISASEGSAAISFMCLLFVPCVLSLYALNNWSADTSNQPCVEDRGNEVASRAGTSMCFCFRERDRFSLSSKSAMQIAYAGRFPSSLCVALWLTTGMKNVASLDDVLYLPTLTPKGWKLRSHAGSRLRANFSRLIEKCELLPACLTQFPKIC